MSSSEVKYSGGKIPLRSDLRVRGTPGNSCRGLVEVRRSARLAARMQSDRAGRVSAAESRSFAGPVESSIPSSGVPRRPAAGCARGGRDGVQLRGLSLRTVRIVLERCDNLIANRINRRENIEKPVGVKLGRRVKRVRFADPIESHLDLDLENRPDNSVAAMPTSSSSFSRSTGLRILQLNMRRSTVVSGEVLQLASEKRLDVLLLQEPYVRKQNSSHTFYGLGTGFRVAAVRSQKPWAAVAICNPNIDMLFVSQLSTTHCVCVEVQAPNFSFYVVSCYFQYSDEIEKHLRHLEMVCHSLRGKRLLVAVDANARSSLWGPQETDERGAKFEDLIRAFGLQVLNDAAQPPTYWTARGSSYIDVTLATPTMSQFIGEWKVRQDWTSSDHNSVDIMVRVPRGSSNDQGAKSNRFDTRRADWDRFSESLSDLSKSHLEVLALQSAEDVELMAQELTVVLQEACKSSMPTKRKYRKSNPWWTKELTIFKKSVYRLRRAVTKGRAEPNYLTIRQEYRFSLRKYSREVRRVKLASWQKFVSSHGNSEAWGYVYKQQANKLRVERVLNTLRRGEYSTNTVEETASYLMDVHIPDDRESEDTTQQRIVRENAHVAPNTAEAPFFTEHEMVREVRTFKNNKAPGPDLIEVKVLKVACSVIPGQIARLFNGCLQWGVFPSVWKRGSLRVLLKAEDKDEKDPKSYRPICLLSVIGKLFEKLIKLRLTDTSLAPENVSDRQFGFMPGRSTEDAIVEMRRVVSATSGRYAIALLFDISGAFDNVWWPLVLDNLKNRNCPKNVFEVLRSYFSDRRVQLELGYKIISKQATRGCPQGSVLGPACWNIMFDGLLRELAELIPEQFIAYADDLIVIVSGNTRKELEIASQKVVDKIVGWCRSAKLELSEKKTEAILLKNEELIRNPIGRRGGDRPDRKRKTNNKRKTNFESRPPIIKIGDARIKFKDSIRYLGVHFDKGMGVRTHCLYMKTKLESLFEKLGKLARATWGLRHRALSTIYRGVFAPVVAYAAAGWADLCRERDIRILKSVQRKVLLPVVGAYRTTSGESLCATAGVTPVEILLQESRARYEIRKGRDAKIGNAEIPAVDDDAVDKIKAEGAKMWQAKWDLSTKGRTTYSFFGDISRRMDARWIQPDRWSAQVLTGHGDFRARLASLGLVDGGACVCGGGDDTVPHFLLECPNFEAQRIALRDIVGANNWKWPDVAPFFVSTPEVFSLFADFCRVALWLKGFE